MYSTVNSCRLCKGKSFTRIFDLGLQVLGSRFPLMDEPDPLSAPLLLIACNNPECSLLQLEHSVSGEELYLNHYGYRSGLNNTMTNHLTNLVREIEGKVLLEAGDIVIDIGSNDATLLSKYGDHLRKIGIDPTGTQFKQHYPENVELIPDFFSAALFKEKYGENKAKVVTTISMFYDLPDPLEVARDIASILHEDGIWVSEQSYCLTMLERNSFDTICHEHLEYYMVKQFQYIAKQVGLVIIDITLNDCNGGSFRITLAHKQKDAPSASMQTVLAREQNYSHSMLTSFIERCERIKEETVTFLRQKVASGKTVYLYGASTKGNTLLQYYGLDNKVITAAAERNPEKYGRRTPGTSIPIISETEMREANPDYLLVLPWHFRDEFVEREKAYLKTGGALIFPLPRFEVVKWWEYFY